VCSVVRFSHTESLRAPVLAVDTDEAVVDVVSRFTFGKVVFNTQTVEPVYTRIARVHVTHTLKRHR